MNKSLAVKYETEKGEVALTIDMVRNFLVSGKPEMVSDSEIVMFLNLAKYQKLNPFLREIYLVKWAESQPANMVVGKDVFTKRAFHNPRFKGMECGIIVISNNQVQFRKGTFIAPKEQLVGGYAKVYVEGWEVPLEHTVSLDEYNTYKSLWKQKPATMIRKVALVQALREAFPDDFQGLYDQSEMAIDEPLPTSEVKVSEGIKNTSEAKYEVLEGMYITKEQAMEIWNLTDDKEFIKGYMKKLGYTKLSEIKQEEFKTVIDVIVSYEKSKEEEEIDESVAFIPEEIELEEETVEEEIEEETTEPLEKITNKQKMVIMGLAENEKSNFETVLKDFGYEKLDDITQKDFDEIAKAVDKKMQE